MKNIFMLIALLFLVACTQGKNEGAVPETPKKGTADGTIVVDSRCELDFSNLKTNTEVALMFNSYRERCNPSEAELNDQLNKLEQYYISQGK